ncbi:MAG: hypothetical protein ACUVWX_04280, partial [Kiritimatiellia bacterium]
MSDLAEPGWGRLAKRSGCRTIDRQASGEERNRDQMLAIVPRKYDLVVTFPKDAFHSEIKH